MMSLDDPRYRTPILDGSIPQATVFNIPLYEGKNLPQNAIYIQRDPKNQNRVAGITVGPNIWNILHQERADSPMVQDELDRIRRAVLDVQSADNSSVVQAATAQQYPQHNHQTEHVHEIPVHGGDYRIYAEDVQPMVCMTCYSVVPSLHQQEHNRWHEQLNKGIGGQFTPVTPTAAPSTGLKIPEPEPVQKKPVLKKVRRKPQQEGE